MITISLRVLIRNLKNSTSDREFKSEMKPKIDVSNERKKNFRLNRFTWMLVAETVKVAVFSEQSNNKYENG